MMSLFEAAWVIARRDFIATVYSRSFVLFLLVPLVMFGVSLVVAMAGNEAERKAAQPVVALLADSATVEAVTASRQRLAAATSDLTFPALRAVPPAENVQAQAGQLLADEEGGYSAALTGTLDRPVLIGPERIQYVAARMQLILDEARRTAALERAGIAPPSAPIERVVTAQAAGNLQMIRYVIAQIGQGVIFIVTLLLATLLLSNLAEEKTNKVIEVLAAAVPLDAVFLGKLIAMLGISLVGLSLWGGMLGIAYLFFQVLQDLVTLPTAGPAVGWPVYIVLVLIYYAVNYMLLGALFLGIGAQASNIREIQTLSMPVTVLQVFVFLLATTVVGRESGALVWTAYLFPFSSPLAMVAYAAKHATLWPHLIALAWQAMWIVLIIRLSARLFRMTVLKSAPGGSFFSLAGLRSLFGSGSASRGQ